MRRSALHAVLAPWLLAAAPGCGSIGFVIPCDHPPADGFACGAGRCGWNYTSR